MGWFFLHGQCFPHIRREIWSEMHVILDWIITTQFNFAKSLCHILIEYNLFMPLHEMNEINFAHDFHEIVAHQQFHLLNHIHVWLIIRNRFRARLLFLYLFISLNIKWKTSSPAVFCASFFLVSRQFNLIIHYWSEHLSIVNEPITSFRMKIKPCRKQHMERCTPTFQEPAKASPNGSGTDEGGRVHE